MLLQVFPYGLRNSIPPKKLSNTDEFVNSDLIHRYLTEKLKSKNDESSFKSNLSHLSNLYYGNYKPTRATSKKHKILIKFTYNKDIIILRPAKRNGVVITDRMCKSKMYELLNDKRKFK